MNTNLKPTKQTYVLNLNDDFIQLAITNAREKINTLENAINETFGRHEHERRIFETARITFETATNTWNAIERNRLKIENQLLEQQQLIETLTSFHKRKGDKTLKIVSSKKKEVDEKYMNVKWLDSAVVVLNREQCFLSENELWALFAATPTIVDACNKNKTKFYQMRPIAISGLMKHVLRKYKSINSVKLIVYNDKFGLPEWMGDNNVPLPAFMKEFMFK